MDITSWWLGAKPHKSIQDGKVNEALFEAKLGEAIEDRGPEEYRDPEIFFQKTFLTSGLRQLLIDILLTMNGERGQNPVANLKTSFGGGKTHTELAIYHLFEHPEASMRVPQVRELVQETGLSTPPQCQIAVLPCTRINPTGRTTPEGLQIRTLWGEMAYKLGGPEAFEIIAENDNERAAPGEDTLEEVLQFVGPSLILFDETLHYVDKVADLTGDGDDSLAKHTVAFLRELTSVVDTIPQNMLVVSLTASRMDQLSSRAQGWLERMEHHVNRLASARTPIEGTEIHEVVRRRLFENIDEKIASQVAGEYRGLYTNMGGLPGQVTGDAYESLIQRSYPFHPELITVLYERWGAKPSFQLTRGTLRFLALTLQDLWQRKDNSSPDLIKLGDVPLNNSIVRAMVRDIAGDPQWESVIGSDVAAPPDGQPAKAELIDLDRGDGQNLAKALATTVLMYSVGGGENPEATRHEIRLACAKQGIHDTQWDDLLEKFKNRLFYLYFDEARYRFRKEPNVTSLHHTYRTNLAQTDEVSAYINKTLLEKALGTASPSHSFAQIYFLPNREVDQDSDQLKLAVLGFDQYMENEELSESAQETAIGIIERHGQVLRQQRNTLVFCVPDWETVLQAREFVTNYLSWRKIQTNATDWDRIGGAQQALVKDRLEDSQSAALQAIINSYRWALVPVHDRGTSKLALRKVQLGTYGPGKLIAPMVWERLTARSGDAQWILDELTAETFMERHSPQAWPELEKWVATSQLWERFTSQVGLPILAKQRVLLDTLDQGQREGLFALGHLADAQNPPDQRDSYVQLYFEEPLPPNVPGIGERWLVLRPELYRQIAHQPEQVTPNEVSAAIEELNVDGNPIPVKAIKKVVASQHRNNIDDVTFQSALAEVVRQGKITFRPDAKSGTTSELPDDDEQVLEGVVAVQTQTKPSPKSGRTIVIKGFLQSVNDMGPVFKRLLQPLASQKPTEMSIELTVQAHFEEDPGSGLDAVLEDGFDNEAFPGLSKEDSKK